MLRLHRFRSNRRAALPWAAATHRTWANLIESKYRCSSRALRFCDRAMTLSRMSRPVTMISQILLLRGNSPEQPRLTPSVLMHPWPNQSTGELPTEVRPRPSAQSTMPDTYSRPLDRFAARISPRDNPSSYEVHRRLILSFVEQIAFSRLVSRSVQLQTSGTERDQSPLHFMAVRGDVPSTLDVAEHFQGRYARREARILRSSETPEPNAVTANVIHHVAPGPSLRPNAQLSQSNGTMVPHQKQPPAPTVNVAQIAEAVLQQIDRRLIAARERMGRI